MARRVRSSKPKPATAVREFLDFIDSHVALPLEQPEQTRLFTLDLAAGRECAGQHIEIPEFGDGPRTPAMKLNYYRESVYKYPGALGLSPVVPPGEEEHYGVCLDPHEDWMLWCRAVAGNTVPARPRQKQPRRATRTANIEAIEDALIEHLIAARDYAYETKDRDGAAQLLPRPSQKWIAERLGISESNVSRCIHDPKARLLGVLWTAASDLGSIMTFEAPPGRPKRS